MAEGKWDPASIDFAALNTLRVVHRLGSFTRAAEHLDVNQSAVSYTIGKLRACFHDPLFVPEGGRQVATLRCEQLLLRAAEMLDIIDGLAQPETFVPGQSTRTVTIACNYYERILLIPRVVAALRAEAPNMSLRVTSALGDGHVRLLEREADVLLGPFERRESGFHARRLFSEEYICLTDPGHPAAGRNLGIEEYLSLKHLLIDYGGTWKSAYLQELEAAGHVLAPTLTVPSPAALSELLAGSNLVATIPRRLADRISDGLVIGQCPFRGAFSLSLVWTQRTNSSAMHRWLRDVILRACRD
ncbi:LysR family transcriptional regulator [Poseidonocella sp. HB161398]|uniref:LysR family transcriptional regulator n=1 Tax=Poseidonocella sp. HB161398 TaxID=2320855 RepID=UPI00110867CB|nr:LysR family transcriptional regulator [Poseidonocella sp. HB161398]